MTQAVTLEELARMVNGTLAGEAGHRIAGAGPFESAAETDVTFAVGAKYLKKLYETAAGAVFVPHDYAGDHRNVIRVKNPQLAFLQILDHFHPPELPTPGVHPTASIDADAIIGQAFHAGANAVVGSQVRIGDRVVLHAGAVIGSHVHIGDDVVVHPNASILDHTRIGNRVVIKSGAVIGSDGFGYVPDGGTYHRIRHTGYVQIDDDVEIGANTTIDRATFGRTWIQRGVKTDNLVHIAHNCVIGEDTILVAQVGISGSVTVGRHVVLAGQVGVAGHLEIGDNAVVGAQSGIGQNVDPDNTVSGSPVIPHRLWLRMVRLLPRLPEMKKRLDKLEKRFDKSDEG